MNQIRGRLPGQCLIALRQLPGAGTVSFDHGVAVPHASGPAKRSRIRSSMISATVSGTNLAHEGSEARMRRRISVPERSEEHSSELQSLMRISYAVFCLTKQIPLSPYTYANLSYQTHTSQHKA